jgi:hypothetical protein
VWPSPLEPINKQQQFSKRQKSWLQDGKESIGEIQNSTINKGMHRTQLTAEVAVSSGLGSEKSKLKVDSILMDRKCRWKMCLFNAPEIVVNGLRWRSRDELLKRRWKFVVEAEWEDLGSCTPKNRTALELSDSLAKTSVLFVFREPNPILRCSFESSTMRDNQIPV